MKVLIVGGVAGGASCAARLRRLDESAEITIIERGAFVSFANCGLPYAVSGVIASDKSLVVATPEMFKLRFNVNVRCYTEAVGIDRERKVLHVRPASGEGEAEELPYDYLVLSPGAAPIKPPLPGMDAEGVFSVRTIPDMQQIKSWIRVHNAKRAVVVGGGFIGLELCENFVKLGLHTTVVEMLNHVMPPLDEDLAALIAIAMRKAGVELVLSDGLSKIEQKAAVEDEETTLCVHTQSGKQLPADMVILAIGVRPESTLAREAGLDLAPRGAIRVSDQMRTSDPSIFAIGDAVETTNIVTGQPMNLALAGPANRQARVAAEAICGLSRAFRGVQGTAVCGLFGYTIAMTGCSYGFLQRSGFAELDDVAVVQLHPGHHVTYYPGAHAIHMKLVFNRKTGRILGLQAVGKEGVEKRVDVVAMAIQLGGTVHDIAEAELCYAPQFGAAKDPVNLAGMLASNVVDGVVELSDWERVIGERIVASKGVAGEGKEEAKGEEATVAGEAEAYVAHAETDVVLDVREPNEYEFGEIHGATTIPLCDLREQMGKLPKDKTVHVLCKEGQRAYYAARVLMQNGYKAKLLSGGMTTLLMHEGKQIPLYQTPKPGIDPPNTKITPVYE